MKKIKKCSKWWPIIPVSVVILGSSSVVLNLTQLHQNSSTNTYYYAENSSVPLITIDPEAKFPLSVENFITWCQDCLINDNKRVDMKEWLTFIGLQFRNTVEHVYIKDLPTVSINGIDTNHPSVKDVTMKLIIYEDGIEKPFCESIKIEANHFAPTLVVPRAINMFKEDFIAKLKNPSTDINRFLANYGFKKDSFTGVQYNNKNFQYDATTGLVTIQFLQYQYKQTINGVTTNYPIYDNVSFNINHVYFKQPLNKDAGAISGIVIACIIVISFLVYCSFKIKKIVHEKQNANKVIPAWQIEHDKPKKEKRSKSWHEKKNLEGSIVGNIDKPIDSPSFSETQLSSSQLNTTTHPEDNELLTNEEDPKENSPSSPNL